MFNINQQVRLVTRNSSLIVRISSIVGDMVKIQLSGGAVGLVRAAQLEPLD